MKVGDKIWDVKINKFKNIKADEFVWGMRDGVDIREYSILGISHLKIVLDDPNFSSYSLRLVNNIITDIRTDNHFMGDGVFVSLISTTPPDKQLLESMVVKAVLDINHKYSWFGEFSVGLNKLIDEYDNTTKVS